jgi:cysteine desulfurase
MEAYLDYNATSPIDPKALEAMKPYLTSQFGNASSFHKKGQAARNAVEDARETLAGYMGVEPGDIVFTSGGTESDNLAIKGTMELLREKRNHLVVSTIEHQAVLHAAKHLESKGVRVTYVPVHPDGVIDLDRLAEAVDEGTALISVMHVNNETGVIQPVREIAQIAHAKGAYFHTDAVQSFGKAGFDIEEGGVDMISISSHKICGPKGAGALYVKKGLKIKAQLHGGHQEKNVRPGTENVAALAGFGRAVQLLSESALTDLQRVAAYRNVLHNGLAASIDGVCLNGHPSKRVYNTVNLSFDGLDGETLLMNLDLKNIFVSTGSACTAGSVEPSHVLLAMGLPEKLARAAIRFSLGRFTTEAEVAYVLNEIPPIVERLRGASTEKAGGARIPS